MKLHEGLKLIYTGDERIMLKGQIITLKEKDLDDMYWTVEEFHGIYTEDYLQENYEPYIETKFKVGDLIKQIDGGKICEITGVYHRDPSSMYDTKVIEGEGYDDWTFSQLYIENEYELFVEEKELTIAEYLEELKPLTFEYEQLGSLIEEITQSRNNDLESIAQLRDNMEKRIAKLQESIAENDLRGTRHAMRQMEIANEITELNKKFGGQ